MTKKKQKGGPMPDLEWSLHPQLAADTTPVGDLALSRLLAINAADYPWLVLVPRRAGAVELADLGSDAFPLTAEIALVSLALKELTRCDKLNIAAIGNIVPQLHIHIVARRKDDPLWPKPIWGVAPPRAGDGAAFVRFIAAIRDDLRIPTMD
jgi:diadenosine tetraphosphate (Ap4A) HIT family hydrolase